MSPMGTNVQGVGQGDGRCLQPPCTTGHRALGRICPTSPVFWPGQGYWAPPKSQRTAMASPATICPCRCFSTAAALKPNAACAQACGRSLSPSPGIPQGISSLAPQTYRHGSLAAPQPHCCRHRTVPCPATGHGWRVRCWPSTPSCHPAHPSSCQPVHEAPAPTAPSSAGTSALALPGAALLRGQHREHGDAQPGRGKFPGAVKREHIEAPRGAPVGRRAALVEQPLFTAAPPGTSHEGGGPHHALTSAPPVRRILMYPLRGMAGPAMGCSTC